MGFNIKDFLNEESKKEQIKSFKVVQLDIELLDLSEKDFYHADEAEIKQLKQTIELVGVQQNLVVRPKTNGRYEIVAGRKRYLALKELIREGYEELKLVPCKVEEEDPVVNELVLIFTNSTQRERTDFEKMQEVKRIKKLLAEYKKKHKLKGRQSEIIAQILGTSKSTVGRLENIDNNLIPPLKEEYEKGNINTTTANKIASKEEEKQQQAYEEYKETGKVTLPEVKEAVELEKTKAPEPDAVNIKDLIVNGRINPNKEYNGIHITDIQELIMLNEQLDFKFWREWLQLTNDGRMELLEAYSGITGTHKNLTYVFTDIALNVRKQQKQSLYFTEIEAAVPLADLRDIINDLITKGRIEINSTPEPESYDDQQILQALKIILGDRNLLTEQEKCALVNIGRNIKARTEE